MLKRSSHTLCVNNSVLSFAQLFDQKFNQSNEKLAVNTTSLKKASLRARRTVALWWLRRQAKRNTREAWSESDSESEHSSRSINVHQSSSGTWTNHTRDVLWLYVPLLLLRPWPWPDDLNIRTWRSYSEDVLHTKNEVSRSRHSKVRAWTGQTDRHTKRRDRMHY